jgi:hypothetical protein
VRSDSGSANTEAHIRDTHHKGPKWHFVDLVPSPPSFEPV